LIALEIAVVGYAPGVTDLTELMHLCWKILAVALALYLLSILSAFSADLSTGNS
jgi:hypothetical protein